MTQHLPLPCMYVIRCIQNTIHAILIRSPPCFGHLLHGLAIRILSMHIDVLPSLLIDEAQGVRRDADNLTIFLMEPVGM